MAFVEEMSFIFKNDFFGAAPFLPSYTGQSLVPLTTSYAGLDLRNNPSVKFLSANTGIH